MGGGLKEQRYRQMRTLTAYGIGVVIVLAVVNFIAWQAKMPRLHSLNVFSAGFAFGVFGTSIAARLYGYRRVT
jgi:pilus assembly protein TadC